MKTNSKLTAKPKRKKPSKNPPTCSLPGNFYVLRFMQLIKVAGYLAR